MFRYLALALALVAVPAAAQLNLPPQLTYDFTPNQPDPVPSTPPPAEKEMRPRPAQTQDLSSLLTTTSTSYRSVVAGTSDQAKVRFTCGDSRVAAYIDQLRGPGKQPFSHLHNFFGGLTVQKDTTTYADLRRAALKKAARGVQASNCPAEWAQGSLYWAPAILVPNALGDGVARVKKHNLVTLYYYFDKIEDAQLGQFFRPGFGTVFGYNMDDPGWTQMAARVNAWNQGHSQTQLQFIAPSGHWKCEDVGVEVDSLEDLPSCPTDKQILASIVSNSCWNGHLRAPDGYSNMIPAVRAGIDGKPHCPREYPWRLPTIETIFRFSHRGVADYSTWYLSSDAHAATILGAPVKRGSTLHTDYIFGWDTRLSDDWQCGLGIQIPGRTCTPHDMDYSTIGADANGVVHRLLSDSVLPNTGGKLLVDLSVRHTGASPSDWLTVPGMTPPPPSKGAIPLHVH